MSRYLGGLGPDRSGSNAFYSDANLNWEPATASDYAPGPGESSAELNQMIARHGAMDPIRLADIEVDDGGRAEDAGDWYEQPAAPAYNPSPFTHAPSAPPVDDSAGLDRLADLLIARIEKKLLGDR